MNISKFHDELLNDDDFNMRRKFYEESIRHEERRRQMELRRPPCAHCDSNRKTREVYNGLWLCEICEYELYDNSDYTE